LFFPVIDSFSRLLVAIDWYDFAFSLASGLVSSARPRFWFVLSDHGFGSDLEPWLGVPHHLRDGLVLTNTDRLPRSPREVFDTVLDLALG